MGRPPYKEIVVSGCQTINGRFLEKDRKIVLVKQTGKSTSRLMAKGIMNTERPERFSTNSSRDT